MVSDMRVGTAVDIHAFSSDPHRNLYLACLSWPGEQGLEGHSDADVVAHAAADAVLIASGIGELGTVFGVDQPQWAGASGQTLLTQAVNLVREAGWTIMNISVQLLGQKPRFAPRKSEAETVMTQIVGAPVSVSASTSDHLGFIGRKEGLAAIATALVIKQ
ncbi:2-C-methyl-D-erythritol 2,4-cyclodiphosphate synthase [Arcanobacterium pinnipediorum]|uniref:2-C-methyl-D-erythritol 2,4-cyclodiphosphate synthase n=1 Tax=Arcanobacterium pinnipediorum TaxID=1503041 RepID=A0ABY5AHG1_9ACTO|nr:2-C-methyl-D-erythritol 2,4-cyclodiphosphate synthase [Arcanobacterium pinnipediorum]USR79287.1 2-C-methyl-D-erythritol 2,4-cyclodiphosphate synthase [Arcanobacterium pinnipediorum]